MTIPKHLIVDELRRRGQHQRAEFVNRQLPDEVDSAQHTGLLNTLHLDFGELASAAAKSSAASGDKADDPA
jgi:hypothetical protein